MGDFQVGDLRVDDTFDLMVAIESGCEFLTREQATALRDHLTSVLDADKES